MFTRFIPEPANMDHSVDLTLYAAPETLWALAQFVKRVQYVHFLAGTVDKQEADMIRDGVQALESALAQKGYAPR